MDQSFNSLLHGLFNVRVAMEDVRAALWINQLGYITPIAQLPGIYGNVNRPCPWATSSDSGQFITAKKIRENGQYLLLAILDMQYTYLRALVPRVLHYSMCFIYTVLPSDCN